MSCLYPPPYFSFLFTHYLSLTIHRMFVCTKCWCLSYVFSAFGLFSYCLPGLFGSSPSQPVCFLALLGCWSGHVLSVCVPPFHRCKLIYLPRSVLHVSLSLCGLSCCIFAGLVTTVESRSSRISFCLVLPCILCSLFVFHWILTCLFIFWQFCRSSVCFEICFLSCLCIVGHRFLFFYLFILQMFSASPYFEVFFCQL